MAYFRNEDEEEQLLRNSEDEALTQLSGGSAVVSPGGTGAPMRSPGAPGSASTLDVNAYLKANQPQAEQLGENVAKGYEAEQKALGDEVGKAESDALGQISSARVDFDQGFVDKVISDPSSIVSDSPSMERFNKTRAGAYTGPDGIANYDDLSSRVSKAKEKGSLADTTGGQKELIRGIAPQTTAGGRELDALLLGQTPKALNRVKEAAGKFGAVENNLQAARTRTTEAAAEAKTSSEMARDRLDAAMKVGTANFGKSVQDRFTSTRDGAVARAQNLVSKIGNPTAAWVDSLTDADLADLDVNRADLKALVGTTADARRSSDVVRSASEVAKRRGLNGVPGFTFDEYLGANGNPLDFSGNASTLDPLELAGLDEFASADEYADAAALRTLGYDPGVLDGAAPAAPAEFDALNFDLGGARGAADSRLKASDDMLIKFFEQMFPERGAFHLRTSGANFFKDLVSGSRPTTYAQLGPELEELQREAVRAAARRGIVNL